MLEEALEGDFAEQAAGLGAAENVFDGLRGEGKAAALFVNGADLFLKLEDLFAGVFKLGGDGGLALRGDAGGGRHALGKGFGLACWGRGGGRRSGWGLV